MQSRKLLVSLIAGAWALLATAGAWAQVPLPGNTIPKWAQPLAAPPVINMTAGGAYKIRISEFKTQILPPGGYNPTVVWGYNGSYPGPTVVARRGVPVKAIYNNQLAGATLQSSLYIDQTIHWADPLNCMMNPLCNMWKPYQGPIPTVAHLHGGEVPSAFDGGPDAWFTPAFGITGPGYVTNEYTYPNSQEATTMFYHDHALGMTRINVYSGMAGFYVLTDPRRERQDLPSGASDIGLAIQDRQFDTNGQLFFPNDGINPNDHPFWIPEFFGDVVVVNGRSWPYVNVEPRRYRFRIVNGSNARFYRMALVYSGRIIPLPVLPQPCPRIVSRPPSMWQIGSDGGYLPNPVELVSPMNMCANGGYLTVAPGERADIIVDFTGVPVGATLTLMNDAPAPFPGGTAPDPATTAQILQFRVVPQVSKDPTVAMSPKLDLRPFNPLVDIRANVKVPVRQLTLNEVMGANGPLEILLNNTRWIDSTTELPRVGATEIWEIVNLTADTHPMHLHLVQFQVIDRRDVKPQYITDYEASFAGGVYQPGAGPPFKYGTCQPGAICGGNPDVTPYAGTPVLPDLNERGWKDTVRMNPGQVTRIVVRWAPQDVPLGNVKPGVNAFPFDPTTKMGDKDPWGYPGGPGYVWHCHIIDHEDNEMMRPYQVVP